MSQKFMKTIAALTAAAFLMPMYACNGSKAPQSSIEQSSSEPVVSEPATESSVQATEPTESVPSDSAVDPMKDTNYTKSNFENGVYTNEYAELKINLPDSFIAISESDIEMQRQSVLSRMSDGKDKEILSASKIDANLSSPDMDSITIKFLNTKQGVKDDSDYSADEHLDYYRDNLLNSLPQGVDCQVGERVTVSLGSKEYVRQHFTMGSNQSYAYVRKLDDALMCIIELTYMSDQTPEHYEAFFE